MDMQFGFKDAKSLILKFLVPLLVVLGGCTHFSVEDCGGKVLGDNQPRIRSSHFRMLLADLPSASERFLVYAAMSSLAYAEDQHCEATESKKKMSPADRKYLEELLLSRGWTEVRESHWVSACEDDSGLYLRVFERTVNARHDVVIAFRGTQGFKDWMRGNAHWLTRFFPGDDQYDRARVAATKILQYYDSRDGGTSRFFTTGHSLGGGLAQHILYANPKRIIQTVAFDPSSVTGFTDQSIDNQIAGCACESTVSAGEPRIYRVYDAYEILSNMRIFHKIFFSPERHIQEVCFPNKRSHSMLGLTQYLETNAKPGNLATPWFRGIGNLSTGMSCTNAFIERQVTSCSLPVTKESWSKCPQ